MEQYRKGSLTIEISLLFPGILFILVLVIYTGLYMYDRCVIARVTCESARKLRNDMFIDSDYSSNDLRNSLMNGIESDIAGKWDVATDIRKTDDEAIIQVQGNMMSANGIFPEYINDIIFSMNMTHRVLKISGPEYIRRKRER